MHRRFRQLAATVTDVHIPQSAQAVDNLGTIQIFDERTTPFHPNARGLMIGWMVKGMNEMG
jgi:hypothetical protein